MQAYTLIICFLLVIMIFWYQYQSAAALEYFQGAVSGNGGWDTKWEMTHKEYEASLTDKQREERRQRKARNFEAYKARLC